MNDRTGSKTSVAYIMATSRHFFGTDWNYHDRVQPEENVSGGDHNPRPVTLTGQLHYAVGVILKKA
jgi:hypothetical protein